MMRRTDGGTPPVVFYPDVGSVAAPVNRSDKEDSPGAVLAYRQDEGSVDDVRGIGRTPDGNRGRCGRFGSVLVNVHERFVRYPTDEERRVRCIPRSWHGPPPDIGIEAFERVDETAVRVVYLCGRESSVVSVASGALRVSPRVRFLVIPKAMETLIGDKKRFSGCRGRSRWQEIEYDRYIPVDDESDPLPYPSYPSCTV